VTLLDACTTLCETVSTTLGPTLSELLMLGALAALGWWRARVAIKKVEAKADAGIAAAHERVSVAKEQTRAAIVQIAEIKGSLRPSAPTGPFEVVMSNVPSSAPSPLPPPPPAARFDEEPPTPQPPRRRTT
jgi:hypothetical protein